MRAKVGCAPLRLNSGNRAMALVVLVGPLFCRNSFKQVIVLFYDKLRIDTMISA